MVAALQLLRAENTDVWSNIPMKCIYAVLYVSSSEAGIGTGRC